MKYFKLSPVRKRFSNGVKIIGLVCLVICVLVITFDLHLRGAHSGFSVSDSLSNGACPVKYAFVFNGACPVKYAFVFHGARVVRDVVIDEGRLETKKNNLRLAIGNLLVFPSELAYILLPILNDIAKMEGQEAFRISSEIASEISEEISESLKFWIVHRAPKLFFGRTLKDYREDKRYTSEVLAEKVGISVSLIYEYEQGNILPNTINVLHIINALELDNSKFLELFNLYQAARLRDIFIKYLEPEEIIEGLEGALGNPDAATKFGEHIKRLIDEKGMSQAQVVAKMKADHGITIDRATMSSILSGKRTPFKRKEYEALENVLRLNLEEKGTVYVEWLDSVVRHLTFKIPIDNLKEVVNFLMQYAPEEVKKILLDDGILGNYIRSFFVH